MRQHTARATIQKVRCRILGKGFEMASKVVGNSGTQLRTVAAVKFIEIDRQNAGFERAALLQLTSQSSAPRDLPPSISSRRS